MYLFGKKRKKERDLRDRSEWNSADRGDWHPFHHTRIIATIRSGFYSNSLKILVAMQIIFSFSARLVWDWQVNNGLCWDCKQFTIGQDDNSILSQVNTNPQIHFRQIQIQTEILRLSTNPRRQQRLWPWPILTKAFHSRSNLFFLQAGTDTLCTKTRVDTNVLNYSRHNAKCKSSI